MKLKVIVSALLLSATSLCFAEITVETYKLAKGTSNEAIYKRYIEGVGRGYEWANARLKSSGQKPLYCQPDLLAMYPDNFVSILETAIAKDPVGGQTPIEVDLLNGLIATFPCKK